MTAVSTQGLGGRKRRDDIWVYFKYNPADDKTECIVTGHGGKYGPQSALYSLEFTVFVFTLHGL